nr:hypothetical protein Iba_chr14bCG16200 [Ipomoea batatas]
MNTELVVWLIFGSLSQTVCIDSGGSLRSCAEQAQVGHILSEPRASFSTLCSFAAGSRRRGPHRHKCALPSFRDMSHGSELATVTRQAVASKGVLQFAWPALRPPGAVRQVLRPTNLLVTVAVGRLTPSGGGLSRSCLRQLKAARCYHSVGQMPIGPFQSQRDRLTRRGQDWALVPNFPPSCDSCGFAGAGFSEAAGLILGCDDFESCRWHVQFYLRKRVRGFSKFGLGNIAGTRVLVIRTSVE